MRDGPRMLVSLARTAAVLIAVGAAITGCATSPYDRDWVSAELSQTAGHIGPSEVTTPSLPPGMPADAGLDELTAAAIALWNSAQFQSELAQLGISRADLAEAGALPNPTFS